ncbi:MAG: flavin monoamine oxidase family protein [Cellvibrionaceae bacterium]
MKKVKVVIVGGGLAGTYLAYLLEKNKYIDYQLFEAKDVLGGRIRGESAVNASETDSVSNESSLTVDLGPTWFWPHQKKIQRLLNQLKVDFFQQYSEGRALYQLFPNAEPEQVNGLGVPLSYRVKGGMSSIIRELSKRITTEKIYLSSPVVSVDKNDQDWVLKVKSENSEKTYLADYLIIATPPRIFTHNIACADLLPEKLTQLLLKTPTWMATQAKFVANYKKPFWREQGLAGDVFSRTGPMMEIHDASADIQNGYALFGFLGMPINSRKLLSANELKQRCLQQLVTLFGSEALQTESMHLKDWANDTTVCTALDISETPQHPAIDLSPYEATLTDKKLSFIGAEYANDEAGYLEGALASVESLLERLPGKIAL